MLTIMAERRPLPWKMQPSISSMGDGVGADGSGVGCRVLVRMSWQSMTPHLDGHAHAGGKKDTSRFAKTSSNYKTAHYSSKIQSQACPSNERHHRRTTPAPPTIPIRRKQEGMGSKGSKHILTDRNRAPCSSPGGTPGQGRDRPGDGGEGDADPRQGV